MYLIEQYHLPILSVVSFLVTVFFICALRKIAKNIGLVDRASHRKLHEGSVPLIGGISIFLGFIFSLLLAPIGLNDYRALFAASVFIIIVGFFDDMHELSSKVKFILEICLALVCILWGNIELKTLGDLLFFGSINLGYFSLLFTIFAMLGVINAINMIDGSDGIAGTTALVQLIFLGYIAFEAHLWSSYYLIILLISAICGFLIFNFPRFHRKKKTYLVFLGDSGSLFIGLFLVWFLISLSQNTQTLASPVVMLWIMALPIYDTIAVIIQRVLQRISPFKPRRDHFHHCFNVQFPIKIVSYSIIINLTCGATGILLKKLEICDSYSFSLFCFLSLVYLIWKLKVKP